MNISQLKALYDLARTAPIPQAKYATDVAELFKVVEAEIELGAAQQALHNAQQTLAAKATPAAE